jgi:hypothetical protein
VSSLLVGLEQGVIYGTIVGIAFGATFGFFGGTHLIRGVGENISPAETVEWDWRNVRQNLGFVLLDGLIIGLLILAVVTLVMSSAGSLFYGSFYGWRHGLVYGLIVGLIGAVASILTGLLNSGWSSDQLDEHQLARPNEGTQRSLYNSLFAGCLFGPIGGLASGAIVGLAFGLIGGLPGWPILAMGFSIICGCVFLLEFVTLRGGIAYIEHFVLRWHLWRDECLPWQYTQFLDYAARCILLRKVGGGYIFNHRLLLEYFATLDVTESVDPAALKSGTNMDRYSS